MNPREQKICDEIIKRCSESKQSNIDTVEHIERIKIDMMRYWLEDNWRCDDLKKMLWKIEYKHTDYLDKRKNLIDIPKYCDETWEKVEVKKIKEYLLMQQQ